MFPDQLFVKTYGIMKCDEYDFLNFERLSVNKKITNKVITKRELMSHIKVELTLLIRCKRKIKDELEKNHKVEDFNVIKFLCDQVFVMFHKMHELFSVEEDILSPFIKFCQEDVDGFDMQLSDHRDKLFNAFTKGVLALKDSLPLWKILIRHLRYKSPEVVEVLFKEATKGTKYFYDENISLAFRPRYLEWCLEFKGIDATRELFNDLKTLKPACHRLYLVMIAIEREEPNYEFDTIRKLFEEVTTLCGRDNVGVWIDYMRFEQENGNKRLNHKIIYNAVFKVKRELLGTLYEQHHSLEKEFWTALGKEVIVIDD
ncbi:uncharacterized protein LOC100569125 isoform X3 [Acyrthosiphon pisum]|uniref:U3 small nucleolar RNA-associated protein 6 homolog C-terminal domain-containing protein n=1 Tax=Acyrthosiphon pisum TaxID=7029 RepID=A0A8R2JUZ6_ACYPI|nr:uncharacterized protein LOC100569125 isoform X3 [Acyrthosiphon pisum]